MENKKEIATDHREEEEVTFREVIVKLQNWLNYLGSKWKIVLSVAFIFGALGLSYALVKRPIYSAACLFVLEEPSSAGLGSYAGLASMAGIDINSLGGAGGLFQGENIIQLYKSRSLIQQTLLSEELFDGKKAKLIDVFLDFTHLRQSWKSKPKLSTVSFSGDPAHFSRLQDSVLALSVKMILNGILSVEKPDKKTSIINVTVNSKSEAFSMAFVNRLVENVNSMYKKNKTKKAAENFSILQHQVDSLNRILNSSMRGIASAVDANPNANIALAQLKVPSQRKQVDYETSLNVYTEMVKNLELAKISLRNETPLIQIIDQPILPLEKHELSPALAAIGGVFAGIALTCLWLIIIKLLQM